MPLRAVTTLSKPHRSKLNWLTRKKCDREVETLQHLGERTSRQRRQRRKAHGWQESMLMPHQHSHHNSGNMDFLKTEEAELAN